MSWLLTLPSLIKEISVKWKLSDLKPVENLSCNYVLSGFQGTQPIILKFGLDINGLNQEANVLMAFADFGAVRVLEQQDGVLLLNKAVPGISLRNYFPKRDHGAVQIACKVIKKLHQAPIPQNNTFTHISDWLKAVNKDWDIPVRYLEKARKLRNKLLETGSGLILLHGNLHHDNILQNNNNWIVIDPKGVIGESAYEVAAFIRNPIPELFDSQDILSIIVNRITDFANMLGLDARRIIKWCFVQAVLTWIWALEDGINYNYFKRLTEIFDIALKHL